MASSSVSVPARDAEVAVLYDPDPETVVRQLARGPIVVVGARPDAIRELGAVRGTILAGWRLLRCNPLSNGGLDPVSERKLFRDRHLPHRTETAA